MLPSRITLLDKLILLRELHQLYASGITLLNIVDVLGKLQQKQNMRQLLGQIKHDLLAGHSLYICISRHPDIFNQTICQLIHVGETSGKLNTVLSDICRHLEKQQELKQSIQRCLFYPCILLGFGLLTCGFLLMMVIPHFAELFQQSGQELPLITQRLFAFSNFITSYHLTILCALLFLGYTLYLKQELMIRLLLKLAPLKKIVHYFYLSQFSRSLSLSLDAGLRLDAALSLYQPGLLTFSNDLLQLKTSIQQGMTLEQSMFGLSSFPIAFRQMIHIGETSGTLSQILEQLARLYDEKLQNYLSYSTQLLEPLIILGLGVLIGGLVISMYLPVFNLGHVL